MASLLHYCAATLCVKCVAYKSYCAPPHPGLRFVARGAIAGGKKMKYCPFPHWNLHWQAMQHGTIRPVRRRALHTAKPAVLALDVSMPSPQRHSLQDPEKIPISPKSKNNALDPLTPSPQPPV